jgi:hypothetical protein
MASDARSSARVRRVKASCVAVFRFLIRPIGLIRQERLIRTDNPHAADR